MRVRRRFFRVARVFAGMFLDFRREYLLMQKMGYRAAAEKMKKRHLRRADQLFSLAVDFGGVYIKLCQFFSARRDLFPGEYVEKLSPLQDSVPPVPFSAIEGVLNREYMDYRKIFRSVDPLPLASASLGQVHRAVLVSGDDVVIKVLKPGVEQSVDMDFAILYHVFRFFSMFESFRRHGDFMELLDELVSVTGDEMNFMREAAVMKYFREEFSKFHYLTVPLVYENISGKRAIVMSRCHGDKVTDIPAWIDRGNDPALISCRLVEIYMEQLLKSRYLHFDPHPGNILVTDNSNIVLLDFGMTGEIDAEKRNGLRTLLSSLVAKDARGMIAAMNDMGLIKKNVNRYALLPVVEFILDEFLAVLRFDREMIYTSDFTPIMDDLIELIYTQPFTLGADWAYAGKTIGVLFAVISRLNPDFNINSDLKPVIEHAMKDEMPFMVKHAAENVLGFVKKAAGMPARIEEFLDSIERGTYRFKVDNSELISEISRMKTFAIRFTSFLIAFGCGLGAILSFEPWSPKFSMLIAAAIPALFIAVFKRNKEARIKDRIRAMLG
jgi:predicted unusual protein kinase regulating ubiquinone biosynthesis (AarF/ABC1/UbiB family)